MAENAAKELKNKYESTITEKILFSLIQLVAVCGAGRVELL